jgi:hypothetical protein
VSDYDSTLPENGGDQEAWEEYDHEGRENEQDPNDIKLIKERAKQTKNGVRI